MKDRDKNHCTDCNCNDSRSTEFSKELDTDHKENKRNRRSKETPYRTSAYAQGTEFANELGVARSRPSDIDTNRHFKSGRDSKIDFTYNSSPYPFGTDFEFEIGDESFIEDNKLFRDAKSYEELEEARKEYFARLRNNPDDNE